jgi:hypothetical protein
VVYVTRGKRGGEGRGLALHSPTPHGVLPVERVRSLWEQTPYFVEQEKTKLQADGKHVPRAPERPCASLVVFHAVLVAFFTFFYVFPSPGLGLEMQ